MQHPLPPLVEPVASLTEDERARTARHAVLAEIGELGQRRLAAASVAIIGAGGLGSPAVLALAAAGIGTLIVIDDDVVELSNLQRQLAHGHDDLGDAKTVSAARAARRLAPAVRVIEHRERLDDTNAERLLAGADLVIDGSDTFATRTAVAAATERLGVPLVWGVVQEFHAQVTVFWATPPAGREGVVLADLYPAGSVGELPTCAAVGVLGSLCLQVGGLLATEAIKLIVGLGEPLLGRVAVIDALRGTVREVPLRGAVRSGEVGGADASGEPTPAASTRDPADADPAGTALADTALADATLASAAFPEIPLVTADEMLQAQSRGAVLLDVREPSETEQGVVEGSFLIPLGDLLADPDAVAGELAEHPVVVICAHGIRAERAALVLADRGVFASVLRGGLAEWVRP